MRSIFVIVGLTLLWPASAEGPQPPAPCQRSWELTGTRPHDPTHFTQGLVLDRGRLFESAGLYGRSALYEKDPLDGRVLRSRPLPDTTFAEGLTRVGQRLIQLSWREQTAYVWSLDLEPLTTLRYPGEGWGLTTWNTPHGDRLILSDGTPVLRILQPDTLAEEARVDVRVAGRPVRLINELEMVGHELLANLWHSDEVAVIDPVSGAVRGWFDFSSLRARLHWPGPPPRETDLNGLAWDESRQRLLVTGKQWPQLFEVRLGACASGVPLRQ